MLCYTRTLCPGPLRSFLPSVIPLLRLPAGHVYSFVFACHGSSPVYLSRTWGGVMCNRGTTPRVRERVQQYSTDNCVLVVCRMTDVGEQGFS